MKQRPSIFMCESGSLEVLNCRNCNCWSADWRLVEQRVGERTFLSFRMQLGKVVEAVYHPPSLFSQVLDVETVRFLAEFSAHISFNSIALHNSLRTVSNVMFVSYVQNAVHNRLSYKFSICSTYAYHVQQPRVVEMCCWLMEWCEYCMVLEHTHTHIEPNAAVHKLKKSCDLCKIGAIRVKYVEFHAEDPKILGVALI
jgi:hypothetical protein